MSLRDNFFFTAGIFFLALSKVRNLIIGYSSPKPFGNSEVDRCINYDIQVVINWLQHLEKYTKHSCFLENKNVLELGPGSDLGVGVYLLSKGCAQYNACDVNDLMKNTPENFYNVFLEKLRDDTCIEKIKFLKQEINNLNSKTPSKLNYVVRDDFDLVDEFGEDEIDIVFSQAAFEHFDNIDITIAQISAVCKPGAVLIALIDLKTHSRWIRDKDPNNIYRYSDKLYEKFWIRGIPNRIRPYQYKEALIHFGWENISIIPTSIINTNTGCSGMNSMFTDHKNEMGVLSIMIYARKS